jgi:hypothetical protein
MTGRTIFYKTEKFGLTKCQCHERHLLKCPLRKIDGAGVVAQWPWVDTYHCKKRKWKKVRDTEQVLD